MTDLSYRDALAEAGVIVAMSLEIRDPHELAIVEQRVTVPALAMAVVMVEADPEFAARWAAAGTDWLRRGELIHEALLFILRPEDAAVAS